MMGGQTLHSTYATVCPFRSLIYISEPDIREHLSIAIHTSSSTKAIRWRQRQRFRDLLKGINISMKLRRALVDQAPTVAVISSIPVGRHEKRYEGGDT